MRLGERQTLKVVKQVEFGLYLAEEGAEEQRVLLPRRQAPEDVRIGDELDVFLYKDSQDRLIATTRQPKLTLGGVALLTVSQVGAVGAFLDWGLEKDLLLPFREQTRKVREGEQCLAALYLDKSSRLCATMNVYPYLSTDSPYRKDDCVTGRVYETSENFGAFVAVDDRYSALIPRRELYRPIRIGDVIQARVTAVKPDGKLDLSIREKAYLQIGQDAQKVLEAIDDYGGALPFTDQASPELIRTQMQMSKNEFKRAVGRLLKEGRVVITEKEIRRCK